jgi:hypothetical protein
MDEENLIVGFLFGLLIITIIFSAELITLSNEKQPSIVDYIRQIESKRIK